MIRVTSTIAAAISFLFFAHQTIMGLGAVPPNALMTPLAGAVICLAIVLFQMRSVISDIFAAVEYRTGQ